MRHIEIKGRIGDLARKIGDLRETARRCRVNVTTLRRWALGECKPHYLVALKVNEVARRERVAAPFEVSGVEVEVKR